MSLRLLIFITYLFGSRRRKGWPPPYWRKAFLFNRRCLRYSINSNLLSNSTTKNLSIRFYPKTCYSAINRPVNRHFKPAIFYLDAPAGRNVLPAYFFLTIASRFGNEVNHDLDWSLGPVKNNLIHYRRLRSASTDRVRLLDGKGVCEYG